MRKKGLFSTLAVLLFMGVGLAACGSSSTASSSSKSASSTTAASSSSTTAAPATLKVGIIGVNTADWPLLIAEKQGYFTQEGLTIDQVTTGSPVTAIDELASGAVDIASDGTDSYASAILKGLPVEIVAPEMLADPYTLITAPSITSWSQLKGKVVSLGTKTDVTAMTFSQMAAPHGLNLSDFTYILAGSTNTRYQALTSGRVQAAILTQPFDLQAESKGYHELASAFTLVKNWAFTMDGVNSNWAKTHGQDIVEYIRALEKAVKFAYANPTQAIQLMSSATGISLPLIKTAYKLDFTSSHSFSPNETVPSADIQAVLNGMHSLGTLPTPPPISKIYNDSYVLQANKS